MADSRLHFESKDAVSDAKALPLRTEVIALLRGYLQTPAPSLKQKEDLLAIIQSFKSSEKVINDTMQNILSWAEADLSKCRSFCGSLFNLLTTPLKITVECKRPEIDHKRAYPFETLMEILQQYQEILQGYQKIRMTSVDRAFLKKAELYQNLRYLGALVKAQPKKFNLDELFSAIDQTITAIEQHPKQAATVQPIIDHMQRIIGRDDLQEVSQSRRTTEDSDSESDSEKKSSHSR